MITRLRNPADWLLDWFGIGKSQVTERNMHSIPAVWYALQKIGGDLGKMPLEPRRMKQDGKGSDPYREHSTYNLLVNEPNGWQTPDVFKELITTHAIGWGNGRAAIIRSGSQPQELIPLMPDRTITEMVDGQKFHATCPDIDDPLMFREMTEELYATGRIPNGMVVLPDRDVLHILGLGYDGVCGYSLARVFKDALGIPLGGQRLMQKQISKGFTGRVMLTDQGGAFAGPDAEKQAQSFLTQFRERYTADKDGEVAGMLRRGMTAEVLTMSNADAQLIEQMKFSRQDVMLIFGLQHLPGDDSATSYNSLAQKKLDQLESTNDRWMIRWEQQCDMKLRTEAEKRAGQLYYRFSTSHRLRMDPQSLSTVLATLVRSMLMTRNEAREVITESGFTDLNPVEDGNEFSNPAITVQGEQPEQNEPVKNMAEIKQKEITKVRNIFANRKTAEAREKAIREFYTSHQNKYGLDQEYVDGRLEEIQPCLMGERDINDLTETWNDQ
jgi:HK97 family phage portal protein